MLGLAILDVPKLLGVGPEELHSVTNVVELAAFDRQIARLGCTAAQHDRVKVFHQLLGRNIDADFDATFEDDAFGLHQLNATRDDLLLKLHVGDTIHEETAWAVSALEERDEVTRFVELIRGGETGRARTDDGDFLAGALFWRLWLDPTFVPGLVDDGALDILNRDGWLDQT